ncbi:MAG: hypothetical protein LBS46_08640 [Dysgonamonadaceae bacterium]|jgi:hypothetical protein|nr:hypothetical protein [Dysgonamonadaceae bacterium]
MANYKYYFFIAMGKGKGREDRECSRETFLQTDLSDITKTQTGPGVKIVARNLEFYCCHYLLKQLLESLENGGNGIKEGIVIDPSEIYVVPNAQWNSPDLGTVREFDFSDMGEFIANFASKLDNPVNQYMKKRFKSWQGVGYGYREEFALIGQLIKLGDKKRKLFGIFG